MKFRGLQTGIGLANTRPNKDYEDLFDLIESPLIRNTERNNVFGSRGTEWTIVDMAADWVQVDRDLPVELKSAGDTIRTTWTMMDASNPAINTDVARVDFNTKKIYWTVAAKMTLGIGSKVHFFNPFRSWELIKNTAPLSLVPGKFNSSYSMPGPIWKHSDGNFRMIISGYNGSVWTAGFASSPDCVTWTYLNSGNYKYIANVAPFNVSWMVAHLMFCGNATKIPGTNNYAALARGYNGTNNTIGVVTFDEDFNVINVPTDSFSIPGVSIPVGYHIQFGSLAYFNNKWYVSTCKRGPVRANDQIYFFEATDIYTNASANTVLVQDGVKLKTWSSQTVEYTILLPFNSNLYMFVSGEGDYLGDSSGVCLGNRQWAIYYLSENTWKLGVGSPYIINPVANEGVYDIDLFWASDHMGSALNFIKDGNYLYCMCSVRGSDYTSYGLKLKLKKS